MVYFQTQNPNLGKFLRALHRLENIDIFYGHLEYFTGIWNILRTSGIFYNNLVHNFRFLEHVPRKIWHPWATAGTRRAKNSE
jgi:hypothetical protein